MDLILKLFVGFILLLLILPRSAYAVTIASQTEIPNASLNVFQLIQELGSNLSGIPSSFTFRVNILTTSTQFDFTAQNSKIYDKTTNTLVATGCIPSNSDPHDRLRGLTFNIEGVPTGYKDVSIDFSCNNYQFIPGHRYLIKISNANIGTLIYFAANAYQNTALDYFPGGGLRYANGNIFDLLNHSGSCDPIAYIWGGTNTFNIGCFVWTTPRDDIYFILSDTPYQPPAPEPFLDLPWDYEAKNISFNEAANSITSYFDHEYPLLSSGFSESNETFDDLVNFRGIQGRDLSYSSHDGYDYAKLAKVNIGDPVLAAAAGEATYVNSCGACGNMIVIDHKNGYQTRYLHLQKDGLITNIPGQKVTVSARQQIGRVGATGNVSPSGDAGAHIHFGVFQDKNKDGNFDDNIPDGVTDPFGWQSKEADPWPNYSFFYNGQQRTGNKSFYLWKKKLDNLNASLTSNGGVFNTERYSLNFPAGSTNQTLNLNIQSSPIVKVNNSLSSIGSTIIATAKDLSGNLITQFQSLFTLTVNFSNFDLSKFNLSTISFYSSPNGINWTKENTTVNLANNTASTQVNHMTHFALMAERVDTVSPTTTADLTGDKGVNNWFRSDVELHLNSQDNEGGLGVDYTMYKLDGSDWEIYTAPITLADEGHHKIEFYSADKDENLEEVNSVEFDIDKTKPEITFDVEPKTIWSPYNKIITVTASGLVTDTNLYQTKILVDDEYNLIEPTFTVTGSNINQVISLQASRDGGDSDGRVYIIKAVTEDLAGNKTEKQVQVVVPHDQAIK